MNEPDVIAAVRRSDQALCEQVAEWEPLDVGVAFTSADHADAAEANQLRDAWVADVPPEEAYARVEAYYRGRGLVCHRWTPASGQPVEPIEALLIAAGWRRCDPVAMHLSDWSIVDGAAEESVRVLPARAMRRAYQATFAEPAGTAAIRQAIGLERLNDSNYDAFVATVDGVAAGRAAYLAVGDIARLSDVRVLTAFQRRGVGRALVRQFVQLARRLLPRAVVASAPATDVEAQRFLARCGFVAAGAVPVFERSPQRNA